MAMSGSPKEIYDAIATGFSFATYDEQRRIVEQTRLLKRFGTTTPTKRQRELYAKRKKKSRH